MLETSSLNESLMLSGRFSLLIVKLRNPDAVSDHSRLSNTYSPTYMRMAGFASSHSSGRYGVNGTASHGSSPTYDVPFVDNPRIISL